MIKGIQVLAIWLHLQKEHQPEKRQQGLCKGRKLK